MPSSIKLPTATGERNPQHLRSGPGDGSESRGRSALRAEYPRLLAFAAIQARRGRDAQSRIDEDADRAVYDPFAAARRELGIVGDRRSRADRNGVDTRPKAVNDGPRLGAGNPAGFSS